MEMSVYEAPALVEIGDFDQLTKCWFYGDCRDFLGCGWAVICI